MSDYQKRVASVIENLGTWYECEGCKEKGVMSKNLYPYEKMFSPIKINKVTIKNRLVMGPMGNLCMAEETGRPSEKMIQYFAERAKGGVGLITSGLIPISQDVDHSVTEPNDLSYFPRIDKSRSKFGPWRDLAEKCHGFGAKFFIQLTPGLGRVGSPECLLTKHKLPVSASWNPNFYIPSIPCKRLSDRGAMRIIKNAGQAAADAKASLIDGVYLHGHEGYLLEQMTNSAFNRRKLGRFNNPQTFGITLIKEIRKRVGPDFPIMYRIDLSLVLNETYKDKMDTVKSLKKFKNERTVDETLSYMKNLVEAGVDVFDVDLGCYDNWWLPHPPAGMSPGCFLEVAKIAKEYFKENKILSNAGLPVPIIAVGKLGYPDVGEQALRDDKCDMLMLARPLLADPMWPNKAYAGRVEDIRPCIGDQEGCINEFVEGGHIQCAVNPKTGFEDYYDGSELQDAKVKKNILVIGAGPAGTMVSLVLDQRGHKVTLVERKDKIGGMLVPGSVPMIKFDILNYRRYLENQIEKSDINLILNKELNIDDLKKDEYDVIIVATGTSASLPKIKGYKESDKIHSAIDFLNNPSIAEGKEKVVIVGGGDVGCETAYYLSNELKKDVTIVEMLPHLMKGSCTANRGFLLHHLEEFKVKTFNCTKVECLDEERIEICRNISKNVPNPYNTWNPILPENIDNPFDKKIKDEVLVEKIPYDLLLFAAGVRKNDSIYYDIQSKNLSKQLYSIGDCFEPGRIFEAVKAAYQVGISI